MIYLDFDGTLVDIWPRFYRVFCDINGCDSVEFEKYKKYKLEYVKDSIVAKKLGIDLTPKYFELKKKYLEDEAYLVYDKPFLEADTVNQVFESRAVILTKRRNKLNFERELKRFNINLPYAVITGAISKKEWISQHNLGENDIVIGDSIEDLSAGELHNVKPVMLLSGLGSKTAFDATSIKYDLYYDINEVIKNGI